MKEVGFPGSWVSSCLSFRYHRHPHKAHPCKPGSPHIQCDLVGLVPLSWLFQVYWAASGVCPVRAAYRGERQKLTHYDPITNPSERRLVWVLLDYQSRFLVSESYVKHFQNTFLGSYLDLFG